MTRHVTRNTHDKALARIRELEEERDRYESRADEWQDKCEAKQKRIEEIENELEEKQHTIFFKNGEIENLKLIIAQLKIRLAKAEGFSQALAIRAGIEEPDFQQGLGDLSRPLRFDEMSQDTVSHHGHEPMQTKRRELWELE